MRSWKAQWVMTMKTIHYSERDDSELLRQVAWRIRCDENPSPFGKDYRLKERLREIIDAKSP